MELNYKISKYQLGKNIHSKVFIIKENISGKEYIVKIYEDPKIINYKNERNILDILNSMNLEQDNNIFIMYKNIQYNHDMFQIPKEVKGFNLEFLFYDYLSKLSLLDYINFIKENKREIYARYLCYKLLKAIDIMQTNNICHNKIDTSNIMLDDNYNLKIIHFSEANIINNKSQSDKDIFGLCQILAKILTLGKFNSINYDKNKKMYLIYYKIQGKNTCIEESKFWMMIKTLFDINVSESFIKLFHIIIKAKKSKELIKINELFKTEWLIEISNEIKNYENIFKKDFEELYKTIIEDKAKKNIINIDIKNILKENKKEISLIDKIFSFFSGENLKEKSNINNENFYGLNNNSSVNSYEEEEEDENSYELGIGKFIEEDFMNFGFKKEKERKRKFMDLLKGEYEDDEISKIKLIPKKISVFNQAKPDISKIESIKEPNLIKDFEIENPIKEKLKINELEKEENIDELKMEFSNNMEQNKIDNYILRGPKKGGINTLNNINDKEENLFKPRKDDFNYIKINIKNNENDDINQALNIFIKKLKEKIKQKYEQIDIKISFKEEKEKSFNIIYQIEPMNINFDDIEFLDDEFEDKMKNTQEFEIKVELMEGDKNIFLTNKINEFYLVFNGISVDKEDFYEHLNILKKIVKNLYI